MSNLRLLVIIPLVFSLNLFTAPVSILQETPSASHSIQNLPQSDFQIPLPPPGSLYHGGFPGGLFGDEGNIRSDELDAYELAAGKKAAWVYFSHNWYQNTDFPLDTVTWIHDRGSIPYIRLMMRSSEDQRKEEKLYKLQSIVDGKFEKSLRAWCRTAASLDYPLLAEFGTEMNGEWFSWNGIWNGAGKRGFYGDSKEPDGPELFRDTYRYIIDVCRVEGAENITWVFHVNGNDVPDENWNHFENYYPGDEYIDWLGVSIYGAQYPFERDWLSFPQTLEEVSARFEKMAPNKPVIVAEMGITAFHPKVSQAEWSAGAFSAMKNLAARPDSRLIGFGWWNEGWQNNDDPAMDTNMRVQDNPELASVFLREVAEDPRVLENVKIK